MPSVSCSPSSSASRRLAASRRRRSSSRAAVRPSASAARRSTRARGAPILHARARAAPPPPHLLSGAARPAPAAVVACAARRRERRRHANPGRRLAARSGVAAAARRRRCAEWRWGWDQAPAPAAHWRRRRAHREPPPSARRRGCACAAVPHKAARRRDRPRRPHLAGRAPPGGATSTCSASGARRKGNEGGDRLALLSGSGRSQLHALQEMWRHVESHDAIPQRLASTRRCASSSRESARRAIVGVGVRGIQEINGASSASPQPRLDGRPGASPYVMGTRSESPRSGTLESGGAAARMVPSSASAVSSRLNSPSIRPPAAMAAAAGRRLAARVIELRAMPTLVLDQARSQQRAARDAASSAIAGTRSAATNRGGRRARQPRRSGRRASPRGAAAGGGEGGARRAAAARTPPRAAAAPAMASSSVRRAAADEHRRPFGALVPGGTGASRVRRAAHRSCPSQASALRPPRQRSIGDPWPRARSSPLPGRPRIVVVANLVASGGRGVVADVAGIALDASAPTPPRLSRAGRRRGEDDAAQAAPTRSGAAASAAAAAPAVPAGGVEPRCTRCSARTLDGPSSAAWWPLAPKVHLGRARARPPARATPRSPARAAPPRRGTARAAAPPWSCIGARAAVGLANVPSAPRRARRLQLGGGAAARRRPPASARRLLRWRAAAAAPPRGRLAADQPLPLRPLRAEDRLHRMPRAPPIWRPAPRRTRRRPRARPASCAVGPRASASTASTLAGLRGLFLWWRGQEAHERGALPRAARGAGRTRLPRPRACSCLGVTRGPRRRRETIFVWKNLRRRGQAEARRKEASARRGVVELGAKRLRRHEKISCTPTRCLRTPASSPSSTSTAR